MPFSAVGDLLKVKILKVKKKGLLKYFVNNLGNAMFDNYVINKEKYDFDILVKTS